MRKNIIFTFYVACTFMLVLSSCGKDSDTEDHKQEVEDVEAAQKREDMKTEGIMQSLCEIIEHEDGSIEYQPRNRCGHIRCVTYYILYYRGIT